LPLREALAPVWAAVFGAEIPGAAFVLCDEAEVVLDNFHADFLSRSVNAPTLVDTQALNQRRHNQNVLLRDAVLDVLARIQTEQMKANRSLTEQIRTKMKKQYDGCFEQRGKGAYARMKDMMSNYLVKAIPMFYSENKKQNKDDVQVIMTQARADLQRVADEAIARLHETYEGMHMVRTEAEEAEMRTPEYRALIEVLLDTMQSAEGAVLGALRGASFVDLGNEEVSESEDVF
jgi:hypothetical protein